MRIFAPHCTLPVLLLSLLGACTAWPGLTAVVLVPESSAGSDSSALLLLGALAAGSSPNTATSSVTPVADAVTPSGPCLGQGFCYLYLSSTSNGAAGGLAGADAVCATSKPGALPGSGSDYKAVIMTNAGDRDQSNAWVLKASTQYRRQDGTTIIGTTNTSQVFALSGGTLNAPPAGAVATTWTGIQVNSDTSWTVATNCLNWTTGPGPNGASGDATSITASSFDLAGQACTNTFSFYCAQQ